jgi:hypothetical protein
MPHRCSYAQRIQHATVAVSHQVTGFATGRAAEARSPKPTRATLPLRTSSLPGCRRSQQPITTQRSPKLGDTESPPHSPTPMRPHATRPRLTPAIPRPEKRGRRTFLAAPSIGHQTHDMGAGKRPPHRWLRRRRQRRDTHQDAMVRSTMSACASSGGDNGVPSNPYASFGGFDQRMCLGRGVRFRQLRTCSRTCPGQLCANRRHHLSWLI